ncbi:hypothetical protein C9374_011425 [Naegleria lovaniensis]|uniref:Uncharacterized protein n=1 Tax=Naegleria lovaniensis TaxID=51637 RepID=A0AA88H0P0_NAELO|nr:uncharacterized protein C9374_011425 [Naegleria lovaniensis]KAG2392700.1 hypothetical protein C9374_011425 [Naegleria lovaniensis]
MNPSSIKKPPSLSIVAAKNASSSGRNTTGGSGSGGTPPSSTPSVSTPTVIASSPQQQLPTTSLVMAVRGLSLLWSNFEGDWISKPHNQDTEGSLLVYLERLIEKSMNSGGVLKRWKEYQQNMDEDENEFENTEEYVSMLEKRVKTTFSEIVHHKRKWLEERKFFENLNICETFDVITMSNLDPHFRYKNRIRFSSDESSSGVVFDPYTCFLVSLENKTTLRNEIDFCKKEGKRVGDERVYKITSQLISTVHYMHLFGVFHSLLCPELICIADNGDIRLKDPFYYHMIAWINGNIPSTSLFLKDTRDFEILVPYLAPELFALACYEDNFFKSVNNKCDVWSIGVILIEFILGNRMPFTTKVDTKSQSKEEWKSSATEVYVNIHNFVEFCKCKNEEENSNEQNTESPFEDDPLYKNAWKRIQRFDKTFRDLLFSCLAFLPSERPDLDWLIEQPFFEIISKEKLAHLSCRITKFPHFKSFDDKIPNFPHHNKEVTITTPLTNPLQEKQNIFKKRYQEWKTLYESKITLFDFFYRRIFDLNITPFIFRSNKRSPGTRYFSNGISQFIFDSYVLIPFSCLDDAVSTIKSYNNNALGISTTKSSQQQISNESPTPSEDTLCPSLIHVSGDIGKKRSLYNNKDTNITWTKFSALIGEKDMDFAYQQQRVHTFRKLLLNYPFSRDEIIKEAKIDIPSILRGEIWAAILGTEDDLEADSLYFKISHDLQKQPLSNVTKRQIAVDVPRCHQYNPLLHSKIGQEKLRNILEAWVFYHKNSNLVYWQGLDSLCAPFLCLHFDFEAKAFCCLNAMVNKYCHQFFTSHTNSTAMEERLAIFKKLHMYHDPELAGHLHHISFSPELYAISWFLTLFAHSLPIEKIYKLWDAIILGSADLPIFIAVAILKQMRTRILQADFHNAMYIFQNIQGVDIMQVLEDCKRIEEKTPRGLTCPKCLQQSPSSPYYISIEGYNKDCLYPRITMQDFEKSTLPSISFIIDIRPKVDFDNHHEPSAFHITRFKPDDEDESNETRQASSPLTATRSQDAWSSLEQETNEYDPPEVYLGYLNQLAAELHFKKGLPIVVIANNKDITQRDKIFQLENKLMLESIPYVSVILDYDRDENDPPLQ